MKNIIEMKDIYKRFEKLPIISGFNLSIKKGEIIGLFGPSGIGKSTILRMIAGLERPDSGRIRVHSTRVGYVFQEARLLPWDTALNNVILPLWSQINNKQKAISRAQYFLKYMGLSEFENFYPHQLSGGMCQRVALARALTITPDILLLDEPFTGLDANLKKNIRQLLEAALETSQAAVIHVTHDPAELLNKTNRIIQLGQQD